MATRVGVLDGGGPKDSENTLNSFLTKCGEKVFWQIGTDIYSVSLKLLWHDKDMKTFIENFYRLMGGNSGKDDSQVCSRDTSAEGQCSERPGNVHGMRKCETVNAFSGLSSNRYVICGTEFIHKMY